MNDLFEITRTGNILQLKEILENNIKKINEINRVK